MMPRSARPRWTRNLPNTDAVIPVQVWGELFIVLVRKAGRSRADARRTLLGWRDSFTTIPTTPEVMLPATPGDGSPSLDWDAIVLSAASRAGCRLLLSEDLQDGFTWGGVTVVNPFTRPQHEMLMTLMSGSSR